MTKIFPTVLVIALASLPVFAQSSSYSIDNFDIRNGVRVQQPQATPRIASSKAGRTKKNPPSRSAATDAIGIADEGASLVKPTVMLTGSLADPVANLSLSSLRGYTTGSAQVDGFLIQSGTSNGVDPLLLYSVMHQESSFKSGAISPKGARGLMQLMPGTASQLGVRNAFDPQSNVDGGTKYLRELLEMYNFDLVKALAAYNAGPQRVERFGGVPPYYETRAYVAKIVRDFNKKKAAQEKAAAAKKNSATTSVTVNKASVPSKKVATAVPQAKTSGASE